MTAMNASVSVFLSVFFAVYFAANFYVGLRFLQSFRVLIEPYALLYWGSYFAMAMSPFVARMGKNYLPVDLHDAVSIAGGYWMAAIYYFFLSWLVVDVVRLLVRLFFPSFQLDWLPVAGVAMSILLVVGALLLYGTWNALQPRIQHYDIAIKKTVPDVQRLRAVMVSDIHLGVVVGYDRLAQMVDSINKLSPDIVFLAGDIIDHDITLFLERKMPEALGKLKPRYGVYAVLGNHEYISGNSQLAVDYLDQAGVKVLRDEYVKVDNQFYVVGRDDRMSARANGRPRLELDQVMAGIDHQLPVFLMDHQPYNLEEGQQSGVDLQLSGHTHHGQFFPNNLVTQRIFEVDWGYLRKENFQIIVSCGFGTWGPPIRIGNQPEIIDITITFGE